MSHTFVAADGSTHCRCGLAAVEKLAEQERPLDVERLAAAICNVEATKAGSGFTYDRFDEEGRALFRAEAAALAAEYAELP